MKTNHPRTDAMRLARNLGNITIDDPVPASFAEKLEQENAEVVAAMEEMLIANHGLPANPADESDPICRAALVQAHALIARFRASQNQAR